MPDRPCRVVQWATGNVGGTAIRHFVDNPAFDLVGVIVTDPGKDGRDAGVIVGIDPIGLVATTDVETVFALKPDCVHFAPRTHDIDMVCRLLEAGINVVTPLGPFYPHGRFAEDLERIGVAAHAGGATFHPSGIHPGFAGDLLPTVLARLMSRIDHIHLYEVVDHLANPSGYIEFMGFGREPADLLANPARSAEAPMLFAQSMEMVANALGTTIDDVSSRIEVATATRDIAWPGGIVKRGTVAGQHYEWTGHAGGRPLITYHCFWTMGAANIAPRWDCGDSGYRIRIEGEPPLEMTLSGPMGPAGRIYPGLPWTAMMGVTAIPDVCDAAPGIATHAELGLVRPRGLLR